MGKGIHAGWYVMNVLAMQRGWRHGPYVWCGVELDRALVKGKLVECLSILVSDGGGWECSAHAPCEGARGLFQAEKRGASPRAA